MNIQRTTIASFAAMILAAGAVVVTACSSSDNGTGNNNTNTPTPDGGQSDGSHLPDASPQRDGSQSGQDGTGTSVGSITISSTRTSVSTTHADMNGIAAFFYSPPQTGGGFAGNMPTGCTTIESVDAGTGTDGGTPSTPISAGDIDVTVGSHTATLTWDDAATMYKPLFSNMAAIWIDKGEDITVDAQGATVPAFSASFKAPHMPSFTSDLTTMKAGTNFELKWDNGAAPEQIQIMLTASGKKAAMCIFDSSKGSGTIPGSTLTDLGAGTFNFTSMSTTATQASAGAGKVNVMAMAMFSSFATIQ